MPAARFDVSDPHLRGRILGRVAAGETLAAVCGEAGMPHQATVGNWARRDPAFRAELAQAKAGGAWRRIGAFDAPRAEALLARVRGGETIASVLRDPTMPSRATFKRWQAEPEFAEAIHALRLARKEAHGARLRRRFRPFDPAVAERLYVRLWKGERLRAILRSEAAFPSEPVLARWRRENPEFDRMMRFVIGGWRIRRGRANLKLTPELEEAIFSGLVMGGSLWSLGKRADMPCAQTLCAWVREKPEFAQMVAQACEYREDWYEDQISEIAERAGELGPKAARKAIGPLKRQLWRLRKRPGWKRGR